MKKEIYIVCIPCGKKHKTKEKFVFGVWTGNCDMCGAENVPVADAGHDFGIYNDDDHRKRDAIQDLL